MHKKLEIVCREKRLHESCRWLGTAIFTLGRKLLANCEFVCWVDFSSNNCLDLVTAVALFRYLVI